MKFNHWIFKLPFMKPYSAIVIGRTILFKGPTADPVLLRHEMIHQEQMDRHGVVGFYLIYLKDFIRMFWKHRDWQQAYRSIPFEVEAYERQWG